MSEGAIVVACAKGRGGGPNSKEVENILDALETNVKTPAKHV